MDFDFPPSRFFGVLLAVIHYGLGNLSHNAVPARVEKVMATGDKFTDYLKTGTLKE